MPSSFSHALRAFRSETTAKAASGPFAFRVVRNAVRAFARDRVMTHAASVAFYTSLSLAPLLVVLLRVLQLLDPEAERLLVDEADSIAGSQAAEVVRSVLQGADQTQGRSSAGILGLAALLFSASGVFVHLQRALNEVFEVRALPGNGVLDWIRKRLLSLAMIGALAFLMAVSLAASAVLGFVVPQGAEGVLAEALNIVVTLGVFTLLFGTVFRLLPDVQLRWRHVLGGAFLTALLFAVGKLGIARYLASRDLASAYGAAGSLIVFLAWIYFSAAITFLGAELVQAWATERGELLRPNRFAERVVD